MPGWKELSNNHNETVHLYPHTNRGIHRPFLVSFPGAHRRRVWNPRTGIHVQDIHPKLSVLRTPAPFPPYLQILSSLRNGTQINRCKTIIVLIFNLILFNKNTLTVTKVKALLWDQRTSPTPYGCDTAATCIFILKTAFSLQSQWKVFHGNGASKTGEIEERTSFPMHKSQRASQSGRGSYSEPHSSDG